jgi:hypothetical protein
MKKSARDKINWEENKKRAAERKFARLQKKQEKNQKREKKIWEMRTMRGGVRVKWRVVGREQRKGGEAERRKIIQ